MTRSSIVFGLGSSATGGVGTGNVSTGDDDDEEEEGYLVPESNPQISANDLTPPDSPPRAICLPQVFSGDLHPSLECYGIKSSTDCSHPLIYFVAYCSNI
ncbi:unnamed protein product [Heterobilharzia americana]|nr:unnamed protein product [Heterobilharzia americana]